MACLSNGVGVPVASQLLQLGGDVHSVSRHPDGVGTPLHLAVAAQNEQLISLLLQYGASPFLVHGDVTPLDVATANNNAPGVRRLEALGLFAGWLRLHREPSVIGTLLGVGIRPVVRWVSVVPRYRITQQGVLCCHQLRLFRHLTDAAPIVVWDVESAVMAADRRSARVTVTPSGGSGIKPVKVLTFSDAGDGSRTPAHLVEACLNRTPPRVPSMPRPAAASPVAASATVGSHAFPSPPAAAAAPVPPPLPPRRASHPSLAEQPALSPEAREAAELEEAIRRSLMTQTSLPRGDTAAGVDIPPPSAPPLPAEADRWSTRHEAAPVPRDGAVASPRNRDSAAGEDDDDDRLCVVCLSEPRAAGLLHGTSMHVCACPACAARLQGGPCPICRAPVERVVAFIYQ